MAANAACNDPEFYVQATALKCLATASRVECMWKDVMATHPKLYVSRKKRKTTRFSVLGPSKNTTSSRESTTYSKRRLNFLDSKNNSVRSLNYLMT